MCWRRLGVYSLFGSVLVMVTCDVGCASFSSSSSPPLSLLVHSPINLPQFVSRLKMTRPKVSKIPVFMIIKTSYVFPNETSCFYSLYPPYV